MPFLGPVVVQHPLPRAQPVDYLQDFYYRSGELLPAFQTTVSPFELDYYRGGEPEPVLIAGTAPPPSGNAVSGTDSGSGSETATPIYNLDDSGTDSEIAAPIYSVADTGTDSETATLAAANSFNETAAGSDTAIVTVPVSASDTGSGSETATPIYNLAEAGSGTETPTISLIATDSSGVAPSTGVTADFATGTNGATISTSNAGSANAFNNVVIGTGAAITYDNAHVKGAAALSAKLNIPHSAQDLVHLDWSSSLPALQDGYFRFYIYLTANPNAQMAILRVADGANNRCAFLRIKTDGKMELFGLGSILGTTAASLTLNGWSRVEGRVKIHDTAGIVEVKLFLGANVDGTTADETLSFTNVVTGFSPVNWASIYFGDFDSGQGVDTYAVWLAYLNAGATSYPGPVLAGGTIENGTVSVPISGSDTGSGSENYTKGYTLAETGTDVEVSTLATVNSASDTGAGSEASAISIVVADSGTGSEISTPAYNVFDTGSGSDASTVNTDSAKTGNETGFGSDDSLFGRVVTDSNTGWGDDWGGDWGAGTFDFALVGILVSDTGTSTQTGIPNVPISASDTGSGADTVSNISLAITADSGTSSETGLVPVPIAVSDTGAGSEASAISIPLADSGTGTETPRIAVGSSDAGTSSDVQGISVILSDSGTDSEAGIVTVPVAVSDSGTSSDASALTAALSGSDTGGGTEASARSAVLSGGDTGAATETPAIALTGLQVDTGAGSENSVIGVQFADTGSGSEISTPAYQVADAGVGTETAGIPITASDSGSGVDSLGGRTVALQDAASEAEDFRINYGLVDTGTGSDSSTVTTDTSRVGVDTGTGNDSAILNALYFAQDDAGVGDTGTAFVGIIVSEIATASDLALFNPVVIDFGTSTEFASASKVLVMSDFGAGNDYATLLPQDKRNYHKSELVSANGSISKLTRSTRKPILVRR